MNSHSIRGNDYETRSTWRSFDELVNGPKRGLMDSLDDVRFQAKDNEIVKKGDCPLHDLIERYLRTGWSSCRCDRIFRWISPQNESILCSISITYYNSQHWGCFGPHMSNAKFALRLSEMGWTTGTMINRPSWYYPLSCRKQRLRSKWDASNTSDKTRCGRIAWFCCSLNINFVNFRKRNLVLDYNWDFVNILLSSNSNKWLNFWFLKK